MSFIEYTDDEKRYLLRIARQCIHAHLHQTDYTLPEPTSNKLKDKGCSFVTLKSAQGELRGCIGALERYQALYKDIAEHALGAAFKDYRFPSVTIEELPSLVIEISVLTPSIEIACNSEADLLRQLTPHEDGLSIDDGAHRATFLPTVWQQLPEKQSFIDQLKRKAGIAANNWPSNMRCYRYHAIEFAET